MSKTWVTYLQDWDNPEKLGLIPDNVLQDILLRLKVTSACMLPLEDGLAAYQLVGEVMAHQGI